jgi:hypothetical protein
MIVMLCLRWWYSAGWRWAFDRAVTQRINSALTAFSVSSLAKTWLSPFKQTHSDARKGSIDLKVQAVVDNFVSRIIGAIARTVLIGCGLFLALFSLVTGLLFVLAWPLIPAGPIIALVGAVL